VKQPLVQILVVVASIQMRTLKTEVEKGAVRTAIGHGLVDPKPYRNWVLKEWDGSAAMLVRIVSPLGERESG